MIRLSSRELGTEIEIGSIALKVNKCCFNQSASRNAIATIINVGLAAPEVGKTELPARYKPLMSWTWQLGSTTPRLGSEDIRVEPAG